MIKNNKGITLIALVVTIVIMGILASVAIYSGTENIKSSNFQQRGFQMESLQLKVNEVYEEYKTKGTINVDNQEIEIENLGTEITDTTKRDEVLKTVEERGTYVGNSQDYRYYTPEDIEKIFNMDDGIDEDCIINIKERVAIIFNGYSYEDKIYYTLNDFNDKIYNVNYKGFNYIVKDGNTVSTITIKNISYPAEFSTYTLSYGKVVDSVENITWTTIENIDYENNKTYDIKIGEAGTYAVKIEINGDALQYSHIEVSPKESKANTPNMKEGMIPVVWDRGTLSWKKADVNNENKTWYDYSTDENMWANVVTVGKNGTYSREFYQNAEVGTKILMSDINAMYVWIPRYTYTTTYYTDDTYTEVSTDETEFYLNQITYSNGVEDSNIEGSNKPTLFGNDGTLKGFWVSKFEASNIDNNINIKPNENSYKNIDFTSARTKVLEMSNENNIYGLTQEDTEVDILLENTWDAVSIISKTNSSKIRNNSYFGGIDEMGNVLTRTGMAGEENIETNLSAETTMKKQTENTGEITLKGLSDTTYKFSEYWTDNGKKASTTGNVSGVYDLVGGCKEYTYSTNSSGDLISWVRGGDYKEYIDISFPSQEVDSNTIIENTSFRVVIF